MVNAGRILIIAQGEWTNLKNYEQLDLVSYNGVAYLARQASVGQDPSADTQMTYWQPFGTVSSIATTSEPGLVMPDGTTITIDATGLIAANVGISDIKDVVLTSLTGDQILRYDSSTSKWVNYSIANIQNPIEAMIATLENGSSTTQAYAIGEHFVRSGKLYKAKAAIAQGANFASLAEGTDYEEETKTVEMQIDRLNGTAVFDHTSEEIKKYGDGIKTAGELLMDIKSEINALKAANPDYYINLKMIYTPFGGGWARNITTKEMSDDPIGNGNLLGADPTHLVMLRFGPDAASCYIIIFHFASATFLDCKNNVLASNENISYFLNYYKKL